MEDSCPFRYLFSNNFKDFFSRIEFSIEMHGEIRSCKLSWLFLKRTFNVSFPPIHNNVGIGKLINFSLRRGDEGHKSQGVNCYTLPYHSAN